MNIKTHKLSYFKPVHGTLFCEYDEFHPETFFGFSLYVEGKKRFIFHNENPIDALNLAFEFIDEYQKQGQLKSVGFSSSIDNFLMDAKVYEYIFDENDGVIGLQLKKDKKHIQIVLDLNKVCDCDVISVSKSYV